MKRKTLWIIIGVVALTAGAGAVVINSGDEELLEVQTATVARETIIQKVNATGRIQPKTETRISADVSARIIALHVEEGDWVPKEEINKTGTARARKFYRETFKLLLISLLCRMSALLLTY